MADGEVVIRLRDVWDVATRTEGKVDLVVLAVADMRDKTLPDHEVRIRTIEKRLYALPSIATLIAAAALVVAILGLSNGSSSVSLPARHRAPQQAVAPAVTVPVTMPVTAAPAATQPRSVPTTSQRHRPHATPPVSVRTSPVLPPVTVTPPTVPSSLVQALESLPAHLVSHLLSVDN